MPETTDSTSTKTYLYYIFAYTQIPTIKLNLKLGKRLTTVITK